MADSYTWIDAAQVRTVANGSGIRGESGAFYRVKETQQVLVWNEASGVFEPFGMVVGTAAPSNADGRLDGTVYVQG